jgi:hypothetical protein
MGRAVETGGGHAGAPGRPDRVRRVLSSVVISHQGTPTVSKRHCRAAIRALAEARPFAACRAVVPIDPAQTILWQMPLAGRHLRPLGALQARWASGERCRLRTGQPVAVGNGNCRPQRFTPVALRAGGLQPVGNFLPKSQNQVA